MPNKFKTISENGLPYVMASKSQEYTTIKTASYGPSNASKPHAHATQVVQEQC